MLLGLGITSVVAFPKVAVSLTTPSQPIEFIEANPENTERLYSEWLLAHRQVKGNYCSCVQTARQISGIKFPPIGYARNLQPNTTQPKVGAIVITDESSAGHLAVIIAINGDELTVKEGNYIPCKLGTRNLNINNESIIGFYE